MEEEAPSKMRTILKLEAGVDPLLVKAVSNTLQKITGGCEVVRTRCCDVCRKEILLVEEDELSKYWLLLQCFNRVKLAVPIDVRIAIFRFLFPFDEDDESNFFNIMIVPRTKVCTCRDCGFLFDMCEDCQMDEYERPLVSQCPRGYGCNRGHIPSDVDAAKVPFGPTSDGDFLGVASGDDRLSYIGLEGKRRFIAKPKFPTLAEEPKFNDMLEKFVDATLQIRWVIKQLKSTLSWMLLHDLWLFFRMYDSKARMKYGIPLDAIDHLNREEYMLFRELKPVFVEFVEEDKDDGPLFLVFVYPSGDEYVLQRHFSNGRRYLQEIRPRGVQFTGRFLTLSKAMDWKSRYPLDYVTANCNAESELLPLAVGISRCCAIKSDVKIRDLSAPMVDDDCQIYIESADQKFEFFPGVTYRCSFNVPFSFEWDFRADGSIGPTLIKDTYYATDCKNCVIRCRSFYDGEGCDIDEQSTRVTETWTVGGLCYVKDVVGRERHEKITSLHFLRWTGNDCEIGTTVTLDKTEFATIVTVTITVPQQFYALRRIFPDVVLRPSKMRQKLENDKHPQPIDIARYDEDELFWVTRCESDDE